MNSISASAPALSRRGFLKSAGLAPGAAPMLAAAASEGNMLGVSGMVGKLRQWQEWQEGKVQWLSVDGEVLSTLEPSSTSEQIGRALHALPPRRLKYTGEIIAVPTPLTPEQREADMARARARSVLPYAA